ncbi:hypothetical protein SMUG_08040 [Gallibacterium anatis]
MNLSINQNFRFMTQIIKFNASPTPNERFFYIYQYDKNYLNNRRLDFLLSRCLDG